MYMYNIHQVKNTTYNYVCTCMYICMYICMYVCMYVYNIFVCMYVCSYIGVSRFPEKSCGLQFKRKQSIVIRKVVVCNSNVNKVL